MKWDLLQRLGRLALLLLAAAVVATSYLVTEPPGDGSAPVTTARAGSAAKDRPR